MEDLRREKWADLWEIMNKARKCGTQLKLPYVSPLCYELGFWGNRKRGHRDCDMYFGIVISHVRDLTYAICIVTVATFCY
jgi:hypothetical protein